MSTSLHLAKPQDLDRLVALVGQFHAEQGIDQSAEVRVAAVAPLLGGIPHGAIYLIGPAKAPIGYVVVTFGWSVEFGGLDAFIDELFIRPSVRGRGIASDVLLALPRALGGAGVMALHLEVDRANPSARRLYERAGFETRDRYVLMSKRL